jgi:hypothetical protein
VPEPSADAFAALARSSPWRWSTLRFTVEWAPAGRGRGAVQAWLRRPDRLRVETVDGGLLRVVRDPRPATPPAPVLRTDGLVAERRGDPGSFEIFDSPFYENYFWTAMLDPVELADGRDRETAARVPALDVLSVIEVDHADRRAWEAVVRTAEDYEPRCACCALLWSRESDLLEYGPDGLRDSYPDAYRVRLDVGTGVCVLTEELDGSPRGRGHDLRIEAVDEPMPDELFPDSVPRLARSVRWGRRTGTSQ